MSNRETGDIVIDVAGQSYTLRMDFNGMTAVESALSTPEKEYGFTEVLARLMKAHPPMRFLQAFIYGALRRYHPEVKLADVPAWIEKAGGIVAVNQQLLEVAASTRPDAEDVSRPPEAQRRSDGTGEPSISRLARSA